MRLEFVDVNLELPISHCWRLPMTRSAGGTADLAPLRNADRSGWLRATCLKPACEGLVKLLKPSV